MQTEADYLQLKAFWNQYPQPEPEAVQGRFISDPVFNGMIEKYLPENAQVLDYGCGSGWASFELYFTGKVLSLTAIDPAENAIRYAEKCAALSHIDTLDFFCGDESLLSEYPEAFDFAITVNVLDVVPDEVETRILEKLRFAVKEKGYCFVGLNPDFSEDELLHTLNMEKKEHYFYRDGILRCNKKTVEAWTRLFSGYFDVLEQFYFTVTEKEKVHPRVGFILQKN